MMAHLTTTLNISLERKRTPAQKAILDRRMAVKVAEISDWLEKTKRTVPFVLLFLALLLKSS